MEFFREAIAAVPGLLDKNMLNCTLYDTANGGDVPECYQYHTVPGQYPGGGGEYSGSQAYLLTMNELAPSFDTFLSVYNYQFSVSAPSSFLLLLLGGFGIFRTN